MLLDYEELRCCAFSCLRPRKRISAVQAPGLSAAAPHGPVLALEVFSDTYAAAMAEAIAPKRLACYYQVTLVDTPSETIMGNLPIEAVKDFCWLSS